MDASTNIHVIVTNKRGDGYDMNDAKPIQALQQGQRGALDRAISHYSSYVASIVDNAGRSFVAIYS